MGDYSDAWREFRAILATTGKKLLKKPNLPQAIQQLNSLSLRIQDEDLPQHAAICHVEMAGLYQKLDQPNEQRKQYLTAASLFGKAWKDWKRGGSRIECHYAQEVSHFYMKAIKISQNLRHYQTAGAVSIEAGIKMIEYECYLDAEKHLMNALNYLEGDFFSQTAAMSRLIEIYLKTKRWEDLLTTIDNLWMMVMKNRPKTTLGQQLLRDCEVTTSGRHKVLLETYGKSLDKKKQKEVKYNENYSDLKETEFHKFLTFIAALDDGDTREAVRLLEQDLTDFISEIAQKVASAVIEEPFPSLDSF